MREVTFKNLTSLTQRKKDIFLKEVFEKDGVIAKTERRCFYFIKEMATLDEDKDLNKWLDSQDKIDARIKRHFHIMKEHNEKIGEDKLICKIAGTFYAIVDKKVYTIGFLHSFKVCFFKESLAK